MSRKQTSWLVDPQNFTSWRKYSTRPTIEVIEPVYSMHCCMRKINTLQTKPRTLLKITFFAVVDIDNEDSTVLPDVTPVQSLVRRSGLICQEQVRLTYDHIITDDEDPDVADIFLASESANFAKATNDVTSEKRPWIRKFMASGNMIGCHKSHFQRTNKM